MNKIIPFGWYPAHWGLGGKALEMAKAEFELTGIELLRKKIDININERSEDEKKIAHLGLDLRTKKIGDYKFAKEVIKVNVNNMPETDMNLALLDLKKEHGKRGDQEYEKERATLLDEPWVYIKKLAIDPENPKFGGVELDWNDKFVEDLEKHGYGPNPDEEETVNDWFNELCRNIALEAYAGVGDFEEAMGVDVEDNTKRTNLHDDVVVRAPVEPTEPASDAEEDDSE